ncbi:CHASE3 domain-containing protein [Luteolibacter luteus]|uniref:histidine kinase n=1 Tax=Luteolibacter luteus TaxID=2728835 RepID=A0A858RK38_9BACT|nr:CHASE3 domain-containing protein [Luteolibacter luteus]QJE96828.1 response regulator [Luteolibacter luteus]
MMRRHLKARYLGPALVALVMIIYGAITSVRNTRTNLTDFGAVDRTRVILLQLQTCVTAMAELEGNQRDYLLTGKEEYLEPYREATKVLDSHLTRLAALAEKNPRQTAAVTMIAEAAGQKKQELEEAIAVRKEKGLEAAVDLVAAVRGEELMDHFRTAVENLQKDEMEVLKAHQQQLVRSFKDTNTVVVTTGVVAITAGVVGTLLLALFLMGKERQERLQFEKEKAVQSDKAKTDFLAMMSHEIRTPMNAILGFGELLHDVVDKPQEKHFAKAIVTSGTSLLSLINDILDLSKIEAAKMELHPETVEMKRFAENLETLFSFRAQEKGLEYSVQLEAGVPPFLFFDALRLRQVLVNLIGNAVKFTKRGSVLVTVSADSHAASDEVTLHFRVSDTGIGISGDKVTEIFRPFYQVETQHGRNFHGTGLGLSISERLVKLMNGEIKVLSQIHKGSVFSVSVPVQRVLNKMPDQEEEDIGKTVDFNRLAPSKVLVVDDVPLNRDLIRGYLEGSHHQVLEAEDGEQAVALCRRQMPDVVLMDIRMPVVDGPSAHLMLKSDAGMEKLPLVAMTASSLLEDQEELKRIFDGFASKPVSRERLYLELAKFLPVHSAGATRRPQPEQQSEPVSHGQEWPALQGELAAMRDTLLPELVELVPAQATLRFAETLDLLAGKHRCPPLTAYAAELNAAAGNMDFAEAGRVLARFPGLIDSLADAHV